jgi:hypothetical protein
MMLLESLQMTLLFHMVVLLEEWGDQVYNLQCVATHNDQKQYSSEVLQDIVGGLEILDHICKTIHNQIRGANELDYLGHSLKDSVDLLLEEDWSL